MGIAAAHLLPIRLHLGVDNKGAVGTVNKILAGKFNLLKRPWAMRADGDVWGIVHSLIQQRGCHATRVSKVQRARHASDGRLRPGSIT